MITIIFPDNNKKLAGAIGRALTEYGASAKSSSVTLKVDASGAIEQIKQATETHTDDGLNNEGDAIDNTSGPSAGDRGGEPDLDKARKEVQKDSDILNADSRQVDTKGVPFNAEFCGKAKEPFYASGTNKGQWKKRKGVEEVDYQQWYTGALLAVTDKPAATQDDVQLDTADAFGTSGQAKTDKPVPKDCGEFMGWVSAQQAAGKLNQHDITDAYSKLGIQVTDLFPPNDPAKISEHVASLFALLGGLE